MQLRPYQTAILDAILTNYRQGVRRQAVVAATGTGKTLCFAQIPSLMHADLPGQILVLVHTEELVEQNAAELRKSNPDLSVDIEMAERHADPNANIIVASVPTLGRARTSRRENFNWDNITICICDELHHSVAETYRRIFETGGFLEAGTHKLLVGFTATPNRSDGTPLKDIYEKIVFDYPIRRGIEENFLCDVTGVRVDTHTCLDYVHTVNGEFNQTELADTVNTPERNSLIVESWIKEAQPRKTIAFTVNIAHAQDLAKAFRQHGIAAEASWGTDPERAAKLARHKSGETLVFTNCAILLEGYNDPSIACIILARPTKSTLLFTQAIGRGTRLFEGKPNCLIIDVVDSTKRHSLASLASLLGLPKKLDLRGQSAIAALKIIEDAAREYPHVDLSNLQDMGKIQEFIQQVNLWEVKFDPEVVKHSALSRFRTMDGGYVLPLANGDRATIKQNLLGKFECSIKLNGKEYLGQRDSLEAAFKATDAAIQEHGGNIVQMVGREQRWHKDSATSKQVATLRRLYKGKAIPADLSKGAACKLISQFFAQNGSASSTPANGPATAGQVRYLNILVQQGKVADFPANISKRDAATLIGRAAGKSHAA